MKSFLSSKKAVNDLGKQTASAMYWPCCLFIAVFRAIGWSSCFFSAAGSESMYVFRENESWRIASMFAFSRIPPVTSIAPLIEPSVKKKLWKEQWLNIIQRRNRHGCLQLKMLSQILNQSIMFAGWKIEFVISRSKSVRGRSCHILSVWAV